MLIIILIVSVALVIGLSVCNVQPFTDDDDQARFIQEWRETHGKR